MAGAITGHPDRGGAVGASYGDDVELAALIALASGEAPRLKHPRACWAAGVCVSAFVYLVAGT